MMRHFFCLSLYVVFATLLSPAFASPTPKNETVVLLHGIAKSAQDMHKIEQHLQQEGYTTLNITYPSTKKDLDEIARLLRNAPLSNTFWKNADKVHIVTHSMGGLVTRRYLDAYKDNLPKDKIGRVVMLAPPNGGSEVADLIHGLWPYKWFYGPAGQELTTAVQATYKSKIYYDLGIIAGTKEWPYITAAFIVPGPGDGRVSVEKTKLSGMMDHVTVNGTHTFIMKRQDTQAHIVHFIKHGAFEHGE